MKRIAIMLCLSFCSTFHTFGQKEDLAGLNDKLFCNVYRYGQADSATVEFLKINFPYLAKQRPKGQLVAPPIGRDAKRTVTGMEFRKHPFFNFNTTHGRLDFATIETPGQPKFETGAELFLYFDNEQSADSAFHELIELYQAASVKQDIGITDTLKTAKFLGEKMEYYAPKALLRLSKDGESFRIYFTNWYRES